MVVNWSLLLLLLCKSAGVGKYWGRMLYAEASPVVECCGGVMRSV